MWCVICFHNFKFYDFFKLGNSLFALKGFVYILQDCRFFELFLFSGNLVCLLYHPQSARSDGDVHTSHPLPTEWEEPRSLVDSRVSDHRNVREKPRYTASFQKGIAVVMHYMVQYLLCFVHQIVNHGIYFSLIAEIFLMFFST